MSKPHFKLALDGRMVAVQPPLRLQRVRALARLRDAGFSVPGWARANGLSPATVKAVLYGNSRGNTGEAHRAAVALGLKSGSVVPPTGFKPLSTPRVEGDEK